MRLIDADALINAIDPMYIAKRGIVADTFAGGCMQFEKLIKQQPTAYDVNKVIEQLEELRDTATKVYGINNVNVVVAICNAIEIVKKGGAK